MTVLFLVAGCLDSRTVQVRGCGGSAVGEGSDGSDPVSVCCPKTGGRASLSRNRAALSAESRGTLHLPGLAWLLSHTASDADGPVTLALTRVPLGSFGRCQVGCGTWRLPSAPHHRVVRPWSPSSRGGIHGNRAGQPETPLPWSLSSDSGVGRGAAGPQSCPPAPRSQGIHFLL